jgi:hypothetical protein
MKAYTRNLLIVLCLTGIQTTSANQAFKSEVGIHILEDVSGPEIQAHGIQAAGYEDMENLCDVVFTHRSTGSISYDVVDENGDDNNPLQFSITPFSEPVPNRRIEPGMTVREKTVALREFEEKKKAFLQKNVEWRTKVLDGAKAWCDECVTLRVKVEEDFLQKLKANHQRQFRRSDLIGAIQQANQQLASSKSRYLILNTDMDHKPGPNSRNQDVRALNHADIAAEVVVVLVNTSGQPNRSALLKGLPNRILTATSLKNAAEVILSDLEK